MLGPNLEEAGTAAQERARQIEDRPPRPRRDVFGQDGVQKRDSGFGIWDLPRLGMRAPGCVRAESRIPNPQSHLSLNGRGEAAPAAGRAREEALEERRAQSAGE